MSGVVAVCDFDHSQACPNSLDCTIMTTQNNDVRAAWLQGASVQCEMVSERNQTPRRLVLLGAPGVGKGTQADLLHQKLRACHLSTGDVFRAAASRSECELSPAMRAATEYMRRGELVPDATVWEMVRERSACLRCSGGFILDGFPRTLSQAESLKQLMESEGLALTAVVSYDLAMSEIVADLVAAGLANNAGRCSTSPSVRQKWRVRAIAVGASCFSGTMTDRNRSRCGWRLTTKAPRR